MKVDGSSAEVSMTEALRAAILHECHRAVAEAADAALEQLSTGGSRPLDYPPHDGQSDDAVLTDAEARALVALVASAEGRSGLRKLLREAASYPLFHLFCLLDGVTDPEEWPGELWLGAELVPPSSDEDREMLHDDYLGSYHDFAQHVRR